MLFSRSGKLIPSQQARCMFSHFNGLDGELIYDTPTMMNVYNITQSFVMSMRKDALDRAGQPLLRFYVFDRVSDAPFEERLASLPAGDAWLIPVKQTLLHNMEELLKFEADCLALGYEGIMLKAPNGPYKQGRSTLNEQYLMKLKRFSEFEAIIVGFEEQMTNTNIPIVDDLGYIERSTSKAGLVPADTLGKLVVDYFDGHLEISCGAMTHEMRKHIWRHQHIFLGKEVVVRHFAVGLDGYRPRFPRFVGFREDGR
jgi:DNA ligase-1